MSQKTSKVAGQAMAFSGVGTKGSGTVASRRLVAVTDTTAAPSAMTDGIESHNQSEAAVQLKCTGGTSATFKMFRCFAESEEWFEATDVGDTTVLAGAKALVNVRLFGCDRFAVQVSAKSASPSAIEAWVSLRSE